MSEITKSKPEFRNLNVFNDLPTYRLPPAGIVSILHRISGILMFFLLPFIIWLLDKSLSSEISFGHFAAAFSLGIGPIPAMIVKLVTLVLIWAYLHHFVAGIRHLYMDMKHATTKEFGKSSAIFTLAVSVLLTIILGIKLFTL